MDTCLRLFIPIPVTHRWACSLSRSLICHLCISTHLTPTLVLNHILTYTILLLHLYHRSLYIKMHPARILCFRLQPTLITQNPSTASNLRALPLKITITIRTTQTTVKDLMHTVAAALAALRSPLVSHLVCSSPQEGARTGKSSSFCLLIACMLIFFVIS